MTCLCQQEILDRLLFSDATCQEDISTCGPTPVRPLLFLVFESTKVCATLWCMCTKGDRVCVPRHSLVLRCVCGDQIAVGVRVTNCWRWTCSVCGPWFVLVVVFLYADGGCMQFHRVGLIVEVLLVKVAERILDGLPAEAARLLDVGNRQEQVQTMLEDALSDIGPTLGLPLRDTMCGVLKVRTVVCLMFASFRNNCLSKVGWTRATHALHRSSFSVQLFRGTVFPRVFSTGFCVCPGCSPISSGGLTLAEKSAAARSHVWQHGVRNACHLVSMCGRAGAQEV